ncbi:MAG: DUF2284 domain-containing protein [Bacillota bacterium]|nr:DUF2284 domain-containing protein [Bacillota bacterium]
MEYTLDRIEAGIDVETYVEDFVDVKGFLECCKACPNYNTIWSCPPFAFHPLEYWGRYEELMVIGYRLNFTGDRTEEEMTDALREVKARVAEELYEMEAEYPGSISLSAGSCSLCERCTKPEGEPCRHQDRMRYSIEALGGNVGKTISELCGVEIEWIEEGKLPDHFVLVGGLLK